jgi:hypothetical protein
MSEGSKGCVEFMRNLLSAVHAWNGLVERLKNLENERKNLLLEIEEFKMAESKEKLLECEVDMLREEVRTLRVLLGIDEPAIDEAQEQKKLANKQLSARTTLKTTD